MGRANYQFRESVIKKRGLHPIWRGIGLIVIVLLTIGGWWLAAYLLDLNARQPFLPFPLPQNFTVTIVKWLPDLPGKLLVQIATVLLLDVVGYAAMVFGYGILSPVRPGPTDAPQPRGRGRRNLVR